MTQKDYSTLRAIFRTHLFANHRHPVVRDCRIFAAAAACAVILGGCSSGGSSASAPTDAAPSVVLKSNTMSVQTGGVATLTWSSANATACTASGGWSGTEPTSGTFTTPALSASTTFTLSCAGATGTSPATAAVTIAVTAPAPTATLTANPMTVQVGSAATLMWSSANTTGCTASGGWSGAEPANGSASTGPLSATKSFTLTCAGAAGTSPAVSTVTVTVVAAPPPTIALTASPASVVSGAATTLNWSSTNATACTASGGWSGSEPPSGSTLSGALSAATTFTLTCTGGGGSHTASATVSITNPNSFSVAPRHAALTLSQSQQFTATVPGGGPATWTVDGISGGNATVGTVSSTGLYVPPATAGTHTVLATSVADPTKSGNAAVAVTDLGGIYAFHVDLPRTGQNLQEYALTPPTVSSSFGKRWSCAVDGDVYAQPLYVANLVIAGTAHNVLFVATQHDSLYAFDADDPNCTTYWQQSFLSSGATTIPVADFGAGCTDISTEVGITGTPVINPAAQVLYVVAATKEGGSYVQRLHALSLATGAEQANSPVAIQASVPINSGGTLTFSPFWQNQRAGLAFTGGGVFIAWSSHCDFGTWHGWLMRYDATTLAQTAVFNSTPNGQEGGIWMSGGAPAVDSSGNLYVTTGNGSFDDSNSVLPPHAPNNDFSMSFLRFDPTTLAVHDFYTPSNEYAWSNEDWDISSSGITILPDGIGPSGHPNLLVGSDKQSHLWLIDRAAMGEFNTAADNTVQYLTLPNAGDCGDACVYATPGYHNGTVYIAYGYGPLMALSLANGLFNANAQAIAVPSSLSAEVYDFPGPSPSISASPAGNGLVWVLDNSLYQGNANAAAGAAILRAYDATNLGATLYSSAALSADTAGNAVKFTVPVVANGHVYVGGREQVTVYGLAP
jgi:hypothetical protein